MARPNERNKFKEAIMEAWNTNESTDDIATRIGISRESILRTIKEEGLPIFRRESFKPHPTKIDSKTKEEIINFYIYRKEKPIKIAEKLDISSSTVFKVIKEDKLTNIRPPIGNDRQDIIDYYNNCKNVGDTAANFKRSYTAIAGFLKRNGIDTSKIFEYKNFDWSTIDLISLLKKHDGSLNAIQKEIGIGAAHLKRYIKENNIAPVNYKYCPIDIIPENIFQEGADLYHKGYTLNEIKECIGLSHHVFKKLLKFKKIEDRRPIRVHIDKYEDFLIYTKQVRRLSKLIRTYLKVEESLTGYHWNHKVSIVDCFRFDIPIDVAASIENQEQIPIIENLTLGFKSKISPDELFLLRGNKNFRIQSSSS